MKRPSTLPSLVLREGRTFFSASVRDPRQDFLQRALAERLFGKCLRLPVVLVSIPLFFSVRPASHQRLFGIAHLKIPS